MIGCGETDVDGGEGLSDGDEEKGSDKETDESTMLDGATFTLFECISSIIPAHSHVLAAAPDCCNESLYCLYSLVKLCHFALH